MLIAHKIALKPNNAQCTFFWQCAGIARKAYNWALAEWKKQYENGEKPSEINLRKQLNAIKREEFPYMLDVPKSVVQQSIKNLGSAYKHFFRKLKEGKKGKAAGYPRWKSRKVSKPAFRIDNGDVRVNYSKQELYVPKLGWVRMCEVPRFEGHITQANISYTGGRWFVSLLIHCDQKTPNTVCDSQAAVGIDLGLKAFAVLSTGEEIQAPKPLRIKLKKLKKLQRSLSRSQLGSNRRFKKRKKVAKLHAEIVNIRQDFLQKLTTKLINTFDIICLEDLCVSGMLRNHKLAQAISDVGWYEFRRQLEYKAKRNAKVISIIPRFYPSSKTCHRCGEVKESLTLATRTFKCDGCGLRIDRDFNAALNIAIKGCNQLEIDFVPQALRESTLVDCEALPEDLNPMATMQIEARSNHRLYLGMGRDE